MLEIERLPLIIHTYRRAKLAKLLDDVIICCDDLKILKIAKKYNAKAMLTSKSIAMEQKEFFEGYKKLKE